jgi:hypothetical protein
LSKRNVKLIVKVGVFKGLVEQKNVVFNSSNKLLFPTTYLESFIYCPSNTLVIESESYLACGC